jgi:hypothetical protein
MNLLVIKFKQTMDTYKGYTYSKSIDMYLGLI